MGVEEGPACPLLCASSIKYLLKKEDSILNLCINNREQL